MTATLLLALRIALALALYAFLAWALLTLWRDMKQHSEWLAMRNLPPLILDLADGGPPRRFAAPLVVIGRGPHCDLPLDDPTVSTRHARLSYHHGQWWLEDLRSTNGTFLNGEPVAAPAVVTGGDEVRCGGVTVRVEVGG